MPAAASARHRAHAHGAVAAEHERELAGAHRRLDRGGDLPHAARDRLGVHRARLVVVGAPAEPRRCRPCRVPRGRSRATRRPARPRAARPGRPPGRARTRPRSWRADQRRHRSPTESPGSPPPCDSPYRRGPRLRAAHACPANASRIAWSRARARFPPHGGRRVLRVDHDTGLACAVRARQHGVAEARRAAVVAVEGRRTACPRRRGRARTRPPARPRRSLHLGQRRLRQQPPAEQGAVEPGEVPLGRDEVAGRPERGRVVDRDVAQRALDGGRGRRRDRASSPARAGRRAGARAQGRRCRAAAAGGGCGA